MSTEAKTKAKTAEEIAAETAAETEEMVEIGPVPYDDANPTNKFLLISCNGDTIMVERGERHRVPKRFADAYEHRVKMAGRKIREREKRARDLREKQNQEGVKFM